MKLNDLKQAVAKAQQDLQTVEGKAADLRRKAKAAKANTEQTRLEYKCARKAAKQAKKLASAAEDQSREQCQVLEKAQKRLAKALKKLDQGKAKQKGKPARPAVAARPPAPSKQTATTQSAITPKPQNPSAAAGGVPAPPAIPTV